MTKFALVDIGEDTLEKLSSYVYEHMESFIRENKEQPEVQTILTQLSAEMKSGLSLEAASNTFKEWIKKDKQHELLSQIYELICKDGVRTGKLKALSN